MEEYENDYYMSVPYDPIDVDICIDKISKAWAEFQASGGFVQMIDPKIDFTELNIDDLIPKIYSDWTLDSAKHIQNEDTDNYPKIDPQILAKNICDEYSLDGFDCNQFSPIQEYVDDIIEHESNLIDKIVLDEFRSNGYGTPDKIRILFDTHFWKLGDMLKNINRTIKEYYEIGILNCSIFAFCTPTEPVKLSDEVIERIKERVEFLYGKDAE